MERCPECGCEQFYEDKTRGEKVCAVCGFVIDIKKKGE
ncbi:MAG: hypothetical protein GTN36_04335 [Candidatus Aenigmarchaeota archaeon]|nr:hypothetical protein [Candidatus Aenigmarchaeota archaeon]